MGNDFPEGVREGLAKCVSQACVYSLEAQKTMLQLHGRIPNIPFNLLAHRWTVGMLTSSFTSGIIFGTYYGVYNRMDGHALSGAVAAFATSVIKSPMSNGIRLMQSGRARNLWHAGKKIVRAHSWRGLYSGYHVGLAEDIIEYDLRARMYRHLSASPWGGVPEPVQNVCKGLTLGAFVGALTAGITTPFDTIKSHMAHYASMPNKRVSAVETAHDLFLRHGAAGFFRGMHLRVASNMVKSALFFSIFECLS